MTWRLAVIHVAPGSPNADRVFFLAAVAELAWLGFLAWLAWIG